MHWIEDLVQQAVEGGASYADVRLVTRTSEQVRVWDGKTEELLSHSSRGFGVRVLVDGAWGFAGSPDLNQRQADCCSRPGSGTRQRLPAE